MARTEAEDRAIRKYEAEKIDKIMIRVPKGMRAQIDAHAEQQGESRNRFITRAIIEAIERDVKEKGKNMRDKKPLKLSQI